MPSPDSQDQANLQSVLHKTTQHLSELAANISNLSVITCLERTDIPPESAVVESGVSGNTSLRQQILERAKNPAAGYLLATNINVATGDIVNVVGETFVDGNHPDLLNYHRQQVAKGEEIIRENITLVKELIETIQGIAGET